MLSSWPAAARTAEEPPRIEVSAHGEASAGGSYFPDTVEALGTATALFPATDLSVDLAAGHPSSFAVRAYGWLHLEWAESERDRYRFRDLYAGWSHGSLDVRAGYQTVSWKVVEGASAADVLNQRDYALDFFAPEKIAEPMVVLRVDVPRWLDGTLELYVLPVFTQVVLAEAGSRYDLFAGTPGVQLVTDASTSYSSPLERFRPQGAARYRFRPAEGIDAAVLYFDGYRRFPVLAMRSPSPPLVEIVPEYEEVHVGGFTLSHNTASGFVLKGEATLTFFQDAVLSRRGTRVHPYATYAIGLERAFAVPGTYDHALRLVFEASGDSDAWTPPEALEGPRFFQSALFVGARYSFDEPSGRQIELAATGDYRTRDLYARVAYRERLYRDLHVEAVVDGLPSAGSSSLSSLEGTLRLGLRVRYLF